MCTLQGTCAECLTECSIGADDGFDRRLLKCLHVGSLRAFPVKVNPCFLIGEYQYALA